MVNELDTTYTSEQLIDLINSATDLEERHKLTELFWIKNNGRLKKDIECKCNIKSIKDSNKIENISQNVYLKIIKNFKNFDSKKAKFITYVDKIIKSVIADDIKETIKHNGAHTQFSEEDLQIYYFLNNESNEKIIDIEAINFVLRLHNDKLRNNYHIEPRLIYFIYNTFLYQKGKPFVSIYGNYKLIILLANALTELSIVFDIKKEDFTYNSFVGVLLEKAIDKKLMASFIDGDVSACLKHWKESIKRLIKDKYVIDNLEVDMGGNRNEE